MLSEADKEAMINEDITLDVLRVAAKLWIDAGMPDYTNGLYEPYKRFEERSVTPASALLGKDERVSKRRKGGFYPHY